MNWKFWEKKKLTKGVLGTTDALGKFLQFGNKFSAETPRSALNLYESSTAVSIPINKVAESFASIRPVLELLDGKLIMEHPLLELLNNPSPFFDSRLFWETLAKYYLITNEVEIIALGGVNRPPLELQPINPANVTMIEGKGGIPHTMDIAGNTMSGAYTLEIKRNRARYFNGGLRELKQIRGFSTKSNSLMRGQSLLVPAAQEARQHILGNTHNVSLLEKGGRLSYVFHYDEDMEPDEFKELKHRVRAEAGGAENAGEIVVSAGGKLTIQEMGTTNKDMDYVKMQREAMNSVALQFKCPLPLITTSASTFNNYGTAILALFDDAALPLADVLYSGVGSLLLPRFGLDPAKVRLTYNILSITALRRRVLEEIKDRKDINIESTNELRELMGRDSVTNGNDILINANMIPLGLDVDDGEPDTPVLSDETVE